MHVIGVWFCAGVTISLCADKIKLISVKVAKGFTDLTSHYVITVGSNAVLLFCFFSVACY